jgi:hypothetical protein
VWLGGAVAGPFAGARVHPEGERAAVERLGGGALCAATLRQGEYSGEVRPLWWSYIVVGRSRVWTSFGFLDLNRFLPLTRVDLGLGLRFSSICID